MYAASARSGAVPHPPSLPPLAPLFVFRLLFALVLAAGPLLSAGCRQSEGNDHPPAANEPIRIVFKHQRIHGEPTALTQVLRDFEAAHPRVVIESEVLLSDTDLQHQFFVTNLEGGSRDFDLMSIDVIWAPEFARAGWLLDLSDRLPQERLHAEFFPGPAEAVTWNSRTWAVPWFIDAGLLYYRKDLLDKYGLQPPGSYTALAASAKRVLAGENDRHLKGFLWQGRQYEGLVCNALEVIRGFGGGVLDEQGRVTLDGPGTVRALTYLRGLIEQGVSPPLTTSADEEVTRNLFNDGHGVFMRNWPYAQGLLEREGSPVRGKVGFMPLPAEAGEAEQAAAQRPGSAASGARPTGGGALSGGTLGGWQLAINRRAPVWKRDVLWSLIEYLSSPQVQRRMLRAYSLNPTRLALYRDPAFIAEEPFAAALLPALRGARPRPVTPYYLMISQVLQSEFSAAVAGIRSPQQTAQRAAAQVRMIIGEPL